MLAQFHRLLKKIAEENQKVFNGEALSISTINRSRECQMAKLRVKKSAEIKPRENTRPVSGHTAQRALPAN